MVINDKDFICKSSEFLKTPVTALFNQNLVWFFNFSYERLVIALRELLSTITWLLNVKEKQTISFDIEHCYLVSTILDVEKTI